MGDSSQSTNTAYLRKSEQVPSGVQQNGTKPNDAANNSTAQSIANQPPSTAFTSSQQPKLYQQQPQQQSQQQPQPSANEKQRQGKPELLGGLGLNLGLGSMVNRFSGQQGKSTSTNPAPANLHLFMQSGQGQPQEPKPILKDSLGPQQVTLDVDQQPGRSQEQAPAGQGQESSSDAADRSGEVLQQQDAQLREDNQEGEADKDSTKTGPRSDLTTSREALGRSLGNLTDAKVLTENLNTMLQDAVYLDDEAFSGAKEISKYILRIQRQQARIEELEHDLQAAMTNVKRYEEMFTEEVNLRKEKEGRIVELEAELENNSQVFKLHYGELLSRNEEIGRLKAIIEQLQKI